MKLNLEKLVKKVIFEELNRLDAFLTEDDVKALLLEDGANRPARTSIVGYPPCPFYKELSRALERWLEEKVCPVSDLPSYPLLDEQHYISEREAKFREVQYLLEGLSTLWNHWNEEEKQYRLRTIFQVIGRRGLLDLLGLRKTVGSQDLFPPSRKLLEDTFNALHSEKAQLTVGARALAKHGHRDQSSSWWGISSGSEVTKNEHANSVMTKIFDGATWINIHQLPQQINIIEVRHADGYGARWSFDGKSFRGFLEPQMEGGHEVGWRH
ncbi:uncharacterized protein LOC141904082 [Tubulanus polymorphus]|uniref:uncharacterized protein LOC141904082 n=1 Tax=Tubulanus polymorphus TaxID=672921 RepID=UPI003DA44440